MKAVTFHDVGDIRLEDVPEPRLQDPADAIVRVTASAICGTDLHIVRGTMTGMVPGTILGHEGVGVVERLGPAVRNFSVGDRVVIMATIACGWCVHCRAGCTAQCDNANPGGTRAGTAFFGGPRSAGSFHGTQAEKVRVPFAHVNMVRLPDAVRDEQAILLSDIFPTGYMAAENADIRPGSVVAVFGCGPVGLFAVECARVMGAGRVIAVDRVPDRLAKARELGAEIVDFEREDPVKVILDLTGGIGADRVIDAVGVDAEHPEHGFARLRSIASGKEREYREQVRRLAPRLNVRDGHWRPGRGPSQVLEWAVKSCAKAGTVSIVGIYPPAMESFPLGLAMSMNLTIKMGNCSHRRYAEKLLELLESKAVDPSKILVRHEPLLSAVEAYEAFDARLDGWIRVELRAAALTGREGARRS